MAGDWLLGALLGDRVANCDVKCEILTTHFVTLSSCLLFALARAHSVSQTNLRMKYLMKER